MYRGGGCPHELRDRPVVANEGGEGHLRLSEMENHVGGHEPRARLDPDPVVAAVDDLPPADVVRRRVPLETQVTDHSPREEAARGGRAFDRGASQLLGGDVDGLAGRHNEEVDVVTGQGVEGPDRRRDVALLNDRNGGVDGHGLASSAAGASY